MLLKVITNLLTKQHLLRPLDKRAMILKALDSTRRNTNVGGDPVIQRLNLN